MDDSFLMTPAKEKMLRGELYDPDAQLVGELERAHELSDQFNALPGNSPAALGVLQQLLGKMGDRVMVRSPFHCDFGSHIFLGDDVFFNYDCVLLDEGEVRAIVGAGSVVTKDVAPMTIVGGNPAKFIKHVESMQTKTPEEQPEQQIPETVS